MRFFRNFLPVTIPAVMMAAMMAMSTATAGGIGYVDARRLIEQAPQGRDIAEQLEAEFAERNRELNGRVEVFKAGQDDLEKNAVLLSAEELRDKSADLQELQRQLARAQREYKEDYERRRNQHLDKLEKIITEVIVVVAKQEELDVVFQQAVYTNPSIDFTERVLTALKKRYKE